MLITSASIFFNFDRALTLAPIPMAARSKVRICDVSRGGIVGSNPAGSMSDPCACCVLSDFTASG